MKVLTCHATERPGLVAWCSFVAVVTTLLVAQSAHAWQTVADEPEQAPSTEAADDATSEDPAAPQPLPTDNAADNDSAEEPTPADSPTPTPVDPPQPTPADTPEPTPAQPTETPDAEPQPIPAGAEPTEAEVAPEPAVEPRPIHRENLTVGGVPVESASFNGIQPGVSTSEDVVEIWGKPAETTKQQAVQTLVYEMKPFKSVNVQISGNRVIAIVIHLADAMTPEDLTRKLRIDELRSVAVVDEEGVVLGLAFPERGVLFGYAPKLESPKVAQLLLEEIHPQSFVLRAESDLEGPYQANIDDLDFAIQASPRDAHAHWLRARVRLAAGHIAEALESIENSIKLDRNERKYRLVKAECLAHQGHFNQAIEEIDAVLAHQELADVVRARALLVKGDLIAEGPDRDYPEALRLHQQAIKLADPLSVSKQVVVRREAKDILVGAHLGIATDIGWGNWKRKPEVVPQWIGRAVAFAKEAIAQEDAGEKLWLRVAQRSLRASAGFKPPVDPGTWITEADKVGKQLLDSTEDPLARKDLHWQLGKVYAQALHIEHLRGQFETGLKYAQLAQAHLEAGVGQRTASEYARVELGQLYFSVGALYAVHKQDHISAVQWYDKAEPLLTGKQSASPTDPARLGESLVSMGVSYWEEGLQQKAIELTQQGARLLETSVARGAVEKSSLAVPYGNLATMSRQLGEKQKAQDYFELANQSKGTLKR